MTFRPISVLRARTGYLRRMLSGPPVMTLVPGLMLGAFWLGGERALILTAIAVPVALILLWGVVPAAARRSDDDLTGRDGFAVALDQATREAEQTSRRCAAILLEVDEFEDFRTRHDSATIEDCMERFARRLRSVLRSRDIVCRLDVNRFGVAISPVRQLDLGEALHLASRLQTALEEPLTLDGGQVYLSVSAGLALDVNLPQKTGPALLSAAQTALAEACRHGPSAMRAYTQEMHAPAIRCGPDAAREASEALDAGQIGPWFQPQISTDTGQVTGVEALARWTHPKRGMISPAEFLPALEQNSRLERLGEVILHGSLSALSGWDGTGLEIPQVGVNFAPEELRNPRLVEKIGWQLDQFELSPGRLSVEILETVVATSPDDTVVRNISGLAALGCRIDLDDFGTGHASISSIRRFDVQRLKIDRSFVMKVDRDPEQQRMVSAILLMAQRLGLDTLAEGVETAGEHAMLAQLGCGHVQGYGIGRPMPPDQVGRWVRDHLARLDDPPGIGQRGTG